MHHFPTLHELTFGAMTACWCCNCGACQAHRQSLRRVLAYPSRRRKHIDAIANRPMFEINAVTDAKSPEFHKQVTDLVVATAMAWSYVLDEHDHEGRTLAVEYFRDAWRHLMTCQTEDALTGEMQTQTSSE